MKLAEAFEDAALSIVELGDALASTKVLTVAERAVTVAQSRQAKDRIYLIRAQRLIKEHEHAKETS